MIIPERLTVQLVDINGLPIRKANILCHLNIYSGQEGYFTYSFIPTNLDGTIHLTRKEIIENTELNHILGKHVTFDENPIKYELFVLAKSTLNFLLNNMKHYLNTSIESIKEDLKKRGLKEQQIAIEIPKIILKIEEDKILYDLLINSSNHEIEFTEKHSKLTGLWTSTSNYQAHLTVKL